MNTSKLGLVLVATLACTAVACGDTQEYEIAGEVTAPAAVSGPITLPVLGDGRLEARFSDFRSVGGLRLAFRIDYELDGQPFLEESVVAYERAAGLAAADPHGPQRDSGASASVLTTRTVTRKTLPAPSSSSSPTGRSSTIEKCPGSSPPSTSSEGSANPSRTQVLRIVMLSSMGSPRRTTV